MNKIKKGDSIIVIAGKDKGKKGEVVRLLDRNKCIVSAINMAKKHTKPNPYAGIEGGIIEKEMPIEICLLYTSPSPRDATLSRMPSSA